jgi:hypothetical protein
MKRCAGLLVCLVAFAATSNSCDAAPLMLNATKGNLDATVTFSTSGNNLVVTLTNSSLSDVLLPTQVLTGVFFTAIGDPTLTPVSAVLGAGSTVLHVISQPAGGVVGGEWAYADGLSGAPLGADEGISSAGLGLFGNANFPGANLDGPTGTNGLQYGITSTGDNGATGNTPVTTEPLIQDTVVFTLSGLPDGFDPSASIKKVSFQYGTSLNDPNITVTPEPGSLALLASGVLGMFGIGWHRRRKAAQPV